MAEPMAGERLDALVDTDPIKLRDEALALLQRAEQAEAEVREVKAALASHGQRDYWKRLALAREQTYDDLRDAYGDAGQQVEEAQAALRLAEVEAEAQKDRAGAVRAHDHVAGALADTGKQLTEAERERDRLRTRVEELSEYELGIKNLTAADGSIDMSLSMAHDMMRALAAGFAEILDAEQAPNFVEMMFKLAKTDDRYTITIRRPGGKTPGEAVGELTRGRDRLAEQVKRLEELIESYPPGSRFAQSGAQELFRRILHGEEVPDVG